MATGGLEVDAAGTENRETTLAKINAKEAAEFLGGAGTSSAGLSRNIQSSSDYSMSSTVSCRICKNSSGMDLVPSPCHCKGSMGAVHKSCLEEWLTGSIRDSCELCSFPFKVIRTRKFSLTQSVWHYVRHYVSFLRFFRDLFFLSVSFMNTVVLMYMWANYILGFVLGNAGAKSRELEQFLDSPLRAIIYFVFFTFCLMFVSVNAVDDVRRLFYFYFLPWYHWWQTNVDVKLVIDDNSNELKQD